MKPKNKTSLFWGPNPSFFLIRMFLIIFIAITIILLYSLLFINKGPPSTKLPKDFEIYYAFGPFESNILDTKNNIYIKDFACNETSFKDYTVELSEAEKFMVYDSIIENDFFDLNDMIPPTGVACLPGHGITLKITANGKTHSVRWLCGYPKEDPNCTKDNLDCSKLKKIANVIDSIISQKEKEMNIPQPICGYI